MKVTTISQQPLISQDTRRNNIHFNSKGNSNHSDLNRREKFELFVNGKVAPIILETGKGIRNTWKKFSNSIIGAGAGIVNKVKWAKRNPETAFGVGLAVTPLILGAKHVITEQYNKHFGKSEKAVVASNITDKVKGIDLKNFEHNQKQKEIWQEKYGKYFNKGLSVRASFH